MTRTPPPFHPRPTPTAKPASSTPPGTANTGVGVLGANIGNGASESQPSTDPDRNENGIRDLSNVGLFVSTFTAGCP